MGAVQIVQIVGFHVMLAVLIEVGFYYLVYSSKTYKDAAEQVEQTFQRYAALAASKVGPSQADALEKQKEVVREKLVAANRGLSRAKGMVSVVLPMIAYAIYPLMTWAFSGLTVATLPFEPFDLVKRWSHQGLEGAGPLDCSYSFIYLLAGMGVRQVFARLIAPRPPKGAGVAGMGANPLADIFQDATERAQQIQKKGSFL